MTTPRTPRRIGIELGRYAMYGAMPLVWAASSAVRRIAPRLGLAPDKLREIELVSDFLTLPRMRRIVLGDGAPQFASLHEMQTGGGALFEHPDGRAAAGESSAARVHDVIVVDDFYDDPDAVRRFALGLEYVPYASVFGRPVWFSSALEVRDNPLKGRGVRLADEAVLRRLEQVVRCPIDRASWQTAGDGWNGAFHYKSREIFPGATSAIHNHTGRESDVQTGWSGLVYLSPTSDPAQGTTIWKHRRTGRCFSVESVYDDRFEDYDLVLRIENKYNRLVLFYASVLHRGEEGFGSTKADARLFQTFFFNVGAADGGTGGPAT